MPLPNTLPNGTLLKHNHPLFGICINGVIDNRPHQIKQVKTMNTEKLEVACTNKDCEIAAIESRLGGVMTTAMCITEYKTDCADNSLFSIYIDGFEDGAWELRSAIVALAESIEDAFEELGNDVRTKFQNEYLDLPCWDFGLVPWVCEKAAETGDIKISHKLVIEWVEGALALLPTTAKPNM